MNTGARYARCVNSTLGETGTKDRYQVTAAARGLDVLDAIAAEARPMTLAEIALAVGLPRATVYRLMRTLQERNWVEREGNDYRLGFKCFQLGAAAAAGLEVRTHSLPFLVELRDRIGVTVQIAKLENWKVVYLERVLTQDAPPIMHSRAGSILPAHCTGLGKVLLAYRNLEDVAAWARREGLPRLTALTITEVPALLAALYEVRERGYAVEEGERQAEIQCIAAPVRDYTGEVVAAISAAGPTRLMPAPLVGSDMAREIVACAAQISRVLGHLPPVSG